MAGRCKETTDRANVIGLTGATGDDPEARKGRTAMVYFWWQTGISAHFCDQPDAPGGRVSLAECVAICEAAHFPSLSMPRRNCRRRKTYRPIPSREWTS
jgi:hypothetical protein